MHALDQVSRATRDPRFNAWARELADVAHRSFRVEGGRGMVWKMSIDLSRPLVPSMGHHDPLDGLLTCVQLQTTAARLSGAPREPDLAQAVADFTALAQGRDWATADPLGVGCLLIDACRVAQLSSEGAFAGGDLLGTLLAAALAGLSQVARQGVWTQPASQRLAFRELGLAIGLCALEPIEKQVRAESGRFSDAAGVLRRIEALKREVALGSQIAAFWRAPEHRRTDIWQEHRDIDEVMLATCLAPDGLLLRPPVRPT